MNWNFNSLEELHAKFGWEEYIVLACILLIYVFIGVYWARRGQNTTSEFLMASKQMSLFPTAMSLACSFISAGTMLGTPAETYLYGTQVRFPIVILIQLVYQSNKLC